VGTNLLIEIELELGEAQTRSRPRTWDVAFGVGRTFDTDALLGSLSDFYLEPQEEGGFVAFSREYSGAVGQGETEQEAITDLLEAIKLLKEALEQENPS